MAANSTHVEESTVTILQAEYDQLIEDATLLSCLRNAGVDNWEGWDDACEAYSAQTKTTF